MINLTDIHVRFGDTDMMGVVYHANYLLYFEDGRSNLLAQAGVPYEDIENAGFTCPVYDVSLHYGSPLRFGEKGILRTSIGKVSATKITYHQEMYREGMVPGQDAPCVTGVVTFCMVDKATFKPVSFKRELPDVYARYLEMVESLFE